MPYCVVVWAVTIPIFASVTLRNTAVGALPVSAPIRRLAAGSAGYHGVVLTVWALVIVTLIGQRFWCYWSTLL